MGSFRNLDPSGLKFLFFQPHQFSSFFLRFFGEDKADSKNPEIPPTNFEKFFLSDIFKF